MILYKDAPSSDLPLTIINLLHKMGEGDLRQEIIVGLTSNNKYISSKFFYDEIGSKLFEEITQLPEYYPTRTEKSILKNLAQEIGDRLKNVDIIELGSGDCSKISILFSEMPPKSLESIRYIPVDVSQAAIEKSAEILIDNFPGLEIKGVVADFTKQLKLIPKSQKRVFCFFGSTIGNFTREQAERFISELNMIMQPGDVLFLGVDRIKNKEILERAYNDKKNVTARFNRNILNVVNSLMDTNFIQADFEHVAFFNREESRIEMHLKAKKDLEINSPYLEDKITIKKDETIHTENSYKFTDKYIRKLASVSGLKIKKIYTDKNKWFSIVEFCKNKKAS